jgi:probable HAF family extracellular repeat protein
MQDLGTLGGSFSNAYGINASGQVVGDAQTAGGADHAFLYDGTAMQDLNGQIPSGSGWELSYAAAINDNGQIVGYGLINGQTHAFLLTPEAAPSNVESVQINDGSDQRSMVNSLTVTFRAIVTMDPGAFEVRHQNSDLVTVNFTSCVVDGKTVATITFAGAEIIGNSLADGNYTLTVLADHVHDADGDPMAANNVTSFYRLFGDTQGHRTVNAADVAVLFSTFGKHAGEDGFLSYLDYNGSGVIDDASLYAFIARYGTTLDP